MIHKVLKAEKGEFILIATSIVLAGALSGLGSYMGGRGASPSAGQQVAFPSAQQNQPQQAANPGTPTNVKLAPVTSADHIRGNLGAKVTIVEYSDPECPFCRMFHPSLQQVTQKYGSQVAWVYRNFPIDALHSKARNEAQATECAADQGGNDGFWKFYDRLFSVTPSNNGLDPAQLPEIAKYAGLDVNQFNTCLSSGKFASKIQASIDSGAAAGVTGTPTSFIVVDGKIVKTVVGAVSESELDGDIAAALKQ